MGFKGFWKWVKEDVEKRKIEQKDKRPATIDDIVKTIKESKKST